MSGITKSIGKAFGRLDGKKVGGAIIAATAAYYLSGGFDSASSGADVADGVAPGGGDESLNLNMDSPTPTGTMDTGGSNDFGGTTPLPMPDGSATDAALAQPAAPGAIESTAPDYSSPAPISAPVDTGAPPQAAPGAPAPVASAPAAPVTTSQPGAPISDLSTPAKVGALPSGAQTMQWFKNLSPGAQAALAGGVAGGAGALMNALAQKHAQEFALEHENRVRADVQRRGQVPAFAPGAITPNGPGIINLARGG